MNEETKLLNAMRSVCELGSVGVKALDVPDRLKGMYDAGTIKLAVKDVGEIHKERGRRWDETLAAVNEMYRELDQLPQVVNANISDSPNACRVPCVSPQRL